MNSLTFFIFVFLISVIMTLVGNSTGATALLFKLPWWVALSYYMANILFGMAIYLASCRFVKWWKWALLVVIAVVEVQVRNATGATLALSGLSRWHVWIFSLPIYAMGIFLAIWIRKLHEERRWRKRKK